MILFSLSRESLEYLFFSGGLRLGRSLGRAGVVVTLRGLVDGVDSRWLRRITLDESLTLVMVVGLVPGLLGEELGFEGALFVDQLGVDLVLPHLPLLGILVQGIELAHSEVRFL
jgi:hypothetical protein